MGEGQRFTWLHITDRHAGDEPGAHLWSNVKHRLFEDLRFVRARTKPWHAVMFTGDVTYSGRGEEFSTATAESDELMAFLKALDPDIRLFAVPGNHDLSRPTGPDLDVVERFRTEPAYRSTCWSNDDHQVWTIVEKAFSNWSSWAVDRIGGNSIAYGRLPGDFVSTLMVGTLRVGVLGLNSAYAQMAGGDLRGSLSLDIRQVTALVDADLVSWVDRHDLTVLLTHHGPKWLDDASLSDLRNEIAPPGRFTAHLFGHQHELQASYEFSPSTGAKVEVLGRSLFGLEHWKGADGRDEERLHGYSVGQVTIVGAERQFRLWPRSLQLLTDGGWHFVADPQVQVGDDQGSDPVPLGPSPILQLESSGPRDGLREDAGPQMVVEYYGDASEFLWRDAYWEALESASLTSVRLVEGSRVAELDGENVHNLLFRAVRAADAGTPRIQEAVLDLLSRQDAGQRVGLAVVVVGDPDPTSVEILSGLLPDATSSRFVAFAVVADVGQLADRIRAIIRSYARQIAPLGVPSALGSQRATSGVSTVGTADFVGGGT